MHVLEGQQEQLVIFPIVPFAHVFFEVSGKFLFQGRYIGFRAELQVSSQPVATPVRHPIWLGLGTHRNEAIKLQMRVRRHVRQNARDDHAGGVVIAKSLEGFANGVCLSKKLFCGFLRHHDAIRFCQHCSSISFQQNKIKNVEKGRIHQKHLIQKKAFFTIIQR